MIELVICHIFLGLVLGLRFRILVLFLAFAAIAFEAALIGFNRGVATAAVFAAAAASAVQLSYLVGAFGRGLLRRSREEPRIAPARERSSERARDDRPDRLHHETIAPPRRR